MTIARRYEERSRSSLSLSTEVRTEDVLAALSAFPAPPSHIPASLAVSNGNGSSSYFGIPRERERDRTVDRDRPPSSFVRSSVGLKRNDSGLSVGSTWSGQSGKSAKLSVRLKAQNEGEGRRDRDSGSGSSTSSGLVVNGSKTSAMPSSPMSGRTYFTAPNSPLPPGTTNGAGTEAAGTEAGMSTRSSSSSSMNTMNTPSSAYPHSYSASPASAYAPSSASMYSSRYAYPSSYAPTSSTSARVASSMLSTPASASTSSSPSSVHATNSAVGMSPIQERDERERDRDRPRTSRRQSSVPPPSSIHRRERRASRARAPDSESGSDIGGPPSVPLPPLPLTTKTSSSFEMTPTPTPGPLSGMRPPLVKSLPSLRSRSKTVGSHAHKRGHGHEREETAVSLASAASVSSSVVPSMVEFGTLTMNRVEAGSESKKLAEDGRPRSRARIRTPRAGTMPLRIDIPPTLAQEKELAQLQRRPQPQQVENPLGSGNSSLKSPLPRDRELGERTGERAADGSEKVSSPTASVFSVASVMTTRSGGLSAAQCLRTRISGMLEGLENVNVPGTMSADATPPATTPTRATPSPRAIGPGGAREEEDNTQRLQNAKTSLHPTSTSEKKMSCRKGSDACDSSALLTAEDLHAHPSLAQATSPVTLVENGHGSSSSFSLEMSGMSRALRAMRKGVSSALTVPSIAQVPPLSDVETDGTDNERAGAVPRSSSESLVGQFPLTPSFAKSPPSSYPFPSSGSQTLRTPILASSSGSNIMSRTMSQSRRKPLPPAPRFRASLSSINTFGSSGDRDSASLADGAVDAIRGRTQGGRGVDRGGASSPDIVTMMCNTPRPVLRSKSLSARSSRSGKSLSIRSSSIRSSNRECQRPSLPSETERQMALARYSAVSSSSSAPPSRMSSIKHDGLSARQSGGSDYADAYGGIEEDADANVDYGVAIARHRGAYDLSPSLPHADDQLKTVDKFGTMRNGEDAKDFYAEEAEALLGDAADNINGSPDEESDSDIDLHTPLPHILLREGVLSPHSKVLASMSSSGTLSMRNSLVGTGRESVASYATNASFGSVMTKSGLFKDVRDTERRRRRHRDGKLLREGLGLTTGLGWSDSEDEDAPSPFTNRVTNITLSRNTSMASVRSVPSKKSQLFSHSTPPSDFGSNTASLHSDRPNLLSPRSSRSPMRQSEPHPLSKSYSSANLSGFKEKQSSLKSTAEENRSMSPTTTSSSTMSLPFPPTPRDDVRNDIEGSPPSGSSDRSRTRTAFRASSVRARTPTANSVKPKSSTTSLRPQAVSVKSALPSRLPSTVPPTPRLLRLPALQLQKNSPTEMRENGIPLQPGQPAPDSGALLGYNRYLHDQQRAQHLVGPKSAPARGAPSDSVSLGRSPTLSAKSAPSTSSIYGGRRAYGSVPVTSSLHPPAGSDSTASRLREPSPSRLSSSMAGLGKPRTGTGMIYRQSSMPATPVGSAI